MTHKRSPLKRQERDLYRHLLFFGSPDHERKEILCTRYTIASVNDLMEAKYGFTLPLEGKLGEVLMESPSISTFNAHRRTLDAVERDRRYSPDGHWSFARKVKPIQGVNP